MTGDRDVVSWEGIQQAIAEIAQVAPADVRRESRLVEDLGMDSVALAETVVFLLQDLGMEAIAEELEDRRWEGVSVGELLDEDRRRRSAQRQQVDHGRVDRD